MYAKFRGVADAKESIWDGKPETAGVYGLWCLANHSCNPNVDWSAEGLRTFIVRDEKVWNKPIKETDERGLNERDRNGIDKVNAQASISSDEPQGRELGESHGIKKGEEIWSHYTDIGEEDFRVRRGRLREVLGGDCMCERCIWEERQWDLTNRTGTD